MTISRRRLIQGSAALAATSAAAAATAKPTTAEPVLESRHAKIIAADARAKSAYNRRVIAAGRHLTDAVGQIPQAVNDDEVTYPNYAGSFTKCLPHDDLGIVDPMAYNALRQALQSNDYSGVILSSAADRRLANPSAWQTFDIHGGDAHSTRIAASPSLGSQLGGVEMIEVYWQSLARDVKFDDYGESTIIADAVTDLNAAGLAIGPRDMAGRVTVGNIFRGSTAGDVVGPYISQLLWMPIQYGAGRIDQAYPQPVAGNDFMTRFDEYLGIQNGQAPARGDVFESTPRYIQTFRDLANYVHNDVLFQAYYNAAQILLGMGGAQSIENPFNGSAAEGGFVTFGGPDVLNMVATAARMALTGAWYQKWLQRKLRPEVFGARIDVQRRGLSDYGIHEDVMASEAVAQTLSKQGNALLAQAFPEGSPTHPAYPAGHACVAGACATVMKAWFNESYEIQNPVVPSADGTTLVDYIGPALTVGVEIDKLANNISIGRNAAGVHYRTDGEEGMLAGEQQALGLLRDYSLSYAREFDGFRLTRFDGTPIRIVNGQIATA